MFPPDRQGVLNPRAARVSPPDWEAVARFLEGDEAGFDTIVKRHHRALRSLLYRLAGNTEDAEDLAQETFLRVSRHLDRFRGTSSLRTWILKIGTNLALDHLRRRAKRPEVALPDDRSARAPAGPRDADPKARAVSREQARRVAGVLETLPPVQRAALVLKVMEGMNYEEIAKVLETTANSVKSSIHLARKKMAALKDDLF